MSDLHERLTALQGDAELDRKRAKARGRWSNRYWSQEWLDVAKRKAARLSAWFAAPPHGLEREKK